MTLREFNEILNNEFDKFYKAKDAYLQKQKDYDYFSYKMNIPFVKQKAYCIGDPLYFIGTNNNERYLIGIVGSDLFNNTFASDTLVSYLDEEVEIAIINIAIDDHKQSVSKIENSDIETRTRWQKELEWHKSEIDKLQCMVDELQENKELEVDR